jgi:ATP-dependent exoDNAse (exonuclease V) beta subunit
MPIIHIITASAGSGKTYRLTELLENKISSGEARPEAVMATTFTRKAAAELQERVCCSPGHDKRHLRPPGQRVCF